jgi:prepilin-type N-terminal cleavage/methylation domain-containing protein
MSHEWRAQLAPPHREGSTVHRIARPTRDESGFTLIELLVVIVVLGILATIVTLAVGGSKNDAVHSSCKTDFKSMQLSAESVNTKTGSYPAAPAGLVKPAGSPALNGELLDALPPTTNYQLVYAPTGSAPYAAFTITVKKPDGTTVSSNPQTSAGCDSL